MRSTRSRPLRHDLVAMTLAAAASAVALEASAAVDAFAKFGDIKGESQDDKHKGYSDVLSWSWSGQGMPRKVGCANELNLVKPIDITSPTLVEFMAQGKLLATAVLAVRKPIPDASDYLVITMTSVAIMALHPGGSQSGEALEQVSLSYASAKVKYDLPDPATGQVRTVESTIEGCPP